MTWIKKVGHDFFEEKDVSPEVYVKEIVSGVHAFDAMAILIVCVCHNQHALVLLQKSYWTTRSANEYLDTFIKLAYVGSGIFKFIVPLEEKPDPQQDAKSDVSDGLHDDSVDDDLAGTGLLIPEQK